MTHSNRTRDLIRPPAFLLALGALLLLAASPALAAPTPAAWSIRTQATTTAAPGSVLRYNVVYENCGDTATNGNAANPYTLQVQLPAGFKATGTLSGWACAPAIATEPESFSCTRSTALTAHKSSLAVIFANVPSIGPGSSDLQTASFSLSGGLDTAGNVPSAGSTVDPTQVTATAPPFGVEAFDAAASSGPDGTTYTQAAGAPYALTTTFNLNSVLRTTTTGALPSSVESLRDAAVELPPGLLGDPAGIARCAQGELTEGSWGCPPAAQVGIATITFPDTSVPVPVYNMVAQPGVAARFAFNVSNTLSFLDVSLRSDGDYGVTVTSHNIPAAVAINDVAVTLWGEPADPAHDGERYCQGQGATSTVSNPSTPATCGYVRPPLTSFLRLPTACSGPQATALHVDSWANPGAQLADGSPDLSDPNWKSATVLSHDPPGYPADPSDPATPWGAPQGATGCDAVPFQPSVSVEPTSHEADSPTGLEVDLSVPQGCWGEVGALCSSDLRDAKVTLPPGMTINPSSADGLAACTEAQFGYLGSGFPAPRPIRFDNSAPSCPDSSKIGTVSIATPLLGENTPGEQDLTGTVYLAKQGENPFGSVLALYLYAKGNGLSIKLAGKVEGDPDTGQLTTTFTDNPQTPFSNLHLVLKSGPRAPLVNPPSCGAHTATTELTGWSGAVARPSDSFQITSAPGGAPCAGVGAFNPAFDAGLVSQLAGGSSPFILKLSRADGEQQFSSLAVKLPPGLAGHLAGIPYCPEADIPSGNCPAASRLGVVQAGAGAGPNTFYVPQGSAYLAGPYKGAPLSMVVTVPAVAGPFNLGNVVVRNQLQVDPQTAQITVVSDPIPQAVQGVATHLRNLYVAIDRQGFISTPTSCDPMSTGAAVGGIGGAVANPSRPFQMLLCNSLDFAPDLKLSFKGGTTRTKHPALKAVLTYPQPGPYANIASTAVTLPHSELLDQSHVGNPCTRPQFAEEACPKISVLGRAKAWTPLLDEPLEGKVYFRANGGERELPDVVADLKGQIHIELVGAVDTVTPQRNARIRTTFFQVPDAPVSKFVLELKGGKEGLLVNSANLCRSPQRAVLRLTAHNNKTYDTEPKIANGCAKKKAKRAARRGTAHR